MLTQQSAIDISKEFVKKVKESGVNLRKAYLYGSFVQNRQHEYSDIDIGLIADEFTGAEPLDYKYLYDVLRNFIDIHVKTYSLEDLSDGEPFLEYIMKNGIEIS